MKDILRPPEGVTTEDSRDFLVPDAAWYTMAGSPVSVPFCLFPFSFSKLGHTMLQTVEALLDEHGNVQLLETVPFPPGQRRRVLITILDEPPVVEEVTLLSEAVLAEDWNRPEEDAAWAYLQPEA